MSPALECDSVPPDTATSVEIRPDDLEQHRRELTGYCYRMLGSGVRGRGRRAGDDGARLAEPRRLRGPVGRALVALPHRHERLPRHVAGPPAPGPADGPGAFGERRTRSSARRFPSTRGCSPSPTRASCPTAPTRPRWPRSRETHPLGVRHRPPAPSPSTAGSAHPARGPALAGDRGGRAARHERGVGQQRAAAGPRHARQPRPRRFRFAPRSTPTSRRSSLATSTPSSATTSPRSWRSSTTTPSCRCRPTTSGCAGAVEMGRWFLGPGIGCRGSRLVATAANGCAAFGSYRSDRRAATLRGRSRSSRSQATGSSGTTTSSTPSLFAAFGLPAHLEP